MSRSLQDLPCFSMFPIDLYEGSIHWEILAVIYLRTEQVKLIKSV